MPMGRMLRLAALLGLAASLVTAGCGSSSNSSSKATSASTEASTASTEASTASTEASTPSSTESFTRSNWDVLVGDPTAYKGASVDFVGRVLAAPEVHAQGVVMQVWEDPKNFANNTIVGYKQPGFQVAQNDYVHVVGTVTGVYTGKNAFGAAVTAPVAVADSVQVVNAIAAAPPAIATRGSRTQIQALIGVLISKVEFAASETRVFMGVINGSKSTVSILASTMAAVQAGQQFDATFSTDYPQVSSELVSGARTSGVVVFPAMNPSGDLKLILQVNSQDTTVGTYGQLTYTFSWGGRR